MKTKLTLFVTALALSTLANSQNLPLLGNALTQFGDFSGTPDRLLELGTTVISDPQPLINLGQETGLPLVIGLSPLLDALLNSPESLPTFLVDGGTLLSPSLAGVPELPGLSQPLPGL